MLVCHWPVRSPLRDLDLGYDIVAAKVEKIDAVINPIEGDEPGLSERLPEVHKKDCCTPTDPALLKEVDAVFVAPIPLWTRTRGRT